MIRGPLQYEELGPRMLLAADLAIASEVRAVGGVPGQVVTLDLEVANYGRGDARAASISLTTDLADLRWRVPATYPSEIERDSLDTSVGFSITGVSFRRSSFGFVTSHGDVNADGYDDLLVTGDGARVFLGRTDIANGDIDITDLNGARGFEIHAPFEQKDPSNNVSLFIRGSGDVNGDTIDDLLLASCCAGVPDVYVVYGHPNLGESGQVEVGASAGYQIEGAGGLDSFFRSLSWIGDVNGDGIGDLVFSVRTESSRDAYFIFGRRNPPPNGRIDVREMDPSEGFVITGLELRSVDVSTAGDVNHDGLPDILIGTSGGGLGKGEAFVVFGDTSLGAQGALDLRQLNGQDGFRIANSDAEADALGNSVSGVGDVNADGIDDFLIGDPSGGDHPTRPGAAYLVYGRENLGESGFFELADLDGENGVALNDNGFRGVIEFGHSVSEAGDVNDDGIDDLIIGAPFGGGFHGAAYVVFGGGRIGDLHQQPLSEVLDGSNGFRLNSLNRGDSGRPLGDQIGFSVSAAGDVNGDGIDDVLIGAPFANLNRGEVYVIFGRPAVEGTADLTLDIPAGTSRTFQVQGRIPAGASEGLIFSATVSPTDSQEDPNLSNNSVTIQVDIVKALEGDVTLDGVVDFADFVVLAEHFGKNDSAMRDEGDLNGDQRVDFADFLILSANFGRVLEPVVSALETEAVDAVHAADQDENSIWDEDPKPTAFLTPPNALVQ